MYDYMRTLQKQFEPQPEFFQNLDGDIRQIHKQLSARLEPEDKKLLLKLIDMEDLLHSEARLHSFISGYRLACAIHMELAEDPMFAFEKDSPRNESLKQRRREVVAWQSEERMEKAAFVRDPTVGGKGDTP